MKQALRYCLLGAALCATSACKKDSDTTVVEQSCASGSPAVKTIASVKGTVGYNQNLQQYVVTMPQPTTIDVADVGVFCAGALPASLQAPGTKVVVSGTLRTYAPQPANLPVGYTYYYLDLASVGPQ
ncbi:MAG: hypothetical protein EOO59_10820 [Hymenobacter sp.]|nr:MAG: hypothetical protein EOO59_10820 [Hymenobacter sp.]